MFHSTRTAGPVAMAHRPRAVGPGRPGQAARREGPSDRRGWTGRCTILLSTGSDHSYVHGSAAPSGPGGIRKGNRKMSSFRKWATPLGLVAAVLVLWLQSPITELLPEKIGGDGASTGRDRRVLDPRDRRHRPALHRPQVGRRDRRRGRGPGVHALPLRQHPGRPLLAADPAVPRLRVDHGVRAQDHRHGLARRRHRPEGLLDRRGRRSRHRQGRDHVRLVPRLPQLPPDQPQLHLVRPARRLRRAGGRRRTRRRLPHRHRGLLRGPHEHVLPARRLGVHEPGHVRLRGRPDPRLARCRLLRRRPLPPADARHPVASQGGHHLDAQACQPANHLRARGTGPPTLPLREPSRSQIDPGDARVDLIVRGRSAAPRDDRVRVR